MRDEAKVLDRRAYIVDQDEIARAVVRRILTSLGIYSEEFSSIDKFLAASVRHPMGCVIIADDAGGGNAVDLIRRLRAAGHADAIVMIAEDVHTSVAVSAGRAGALEVLSRADLPNRLEKVLQAAFDQVNAKSLNGNGHNGYSLSPRERQVLAALTRGHASRGVAEQLGLSVRTIEMHRATILKKLGAKNISQAIALTKDEGLF